MLVQGLDPLLRAGYEPQTLLLTMVLGMGGAIAAGFLFGTVLRIPGMGGIFGATLGAIGILSSNRLCPTEAEM